MNQISEIRATHQLRWFAAQFAIIVLGVLAALAVDSWRERRSLAVDEMFYLRQLQTELTSTERDLAFSIASMRGSIHASSSLLKAFRNPDSIPADSLTRWIAEVGWYATPSVTLGVARGLVSGQLAVVSDDSLRALLPALIDHADMFRTVQQQTYESFINYSNQLRQKAPFAQRLATMMRTDSANLWGAYQEMPFTSDRLTAFPTTYADLLDDREVFVIIDGLFDYGSDMSAFQRRMLDMVTFMRELVDRRLARAGSAS